MSKFHAYHNLDKQGPFGGTDFYTTFRTNVGDMLYVVLGKENKTTKKSDYFLSGKYLVKSVRPNESTGAHAKKKWHLKIETTEKCESPVLFSNLSAFDREKYRNKIISTGGFKQISETTSEFFELFDGIIEEAKAVVEGDSFERGDGVVQKRGEALEAQIAVSESAQKDLESDTASLSTSEREAVVKVRFGQGSFRTSLLDIAGEVCWMSGIEGRELLIASHIQPWAHCEKNLEARGCPDNGLLLSSLWDAAFDAGLVTFDEEWRAIPSPALSGSAKKHLGLQEDMFLPERFRNLPRSQYLAYHRAVVFKR